ncbi:MAG: GTP 3',8-cyclase MoaA [Acidobacteriota bacterium]
MSDSSTSSSGALQGAAGLPSASPLDRLGRGLRDLRISVTDRCNFRCPFCMPAHKKYQFLPRRELLSFEEIERVTRLFVSLGVRKVRLTGGEPLLRSELPRLVEMLAGIPGVEDLALTTNGLKLAPLAQQLADAGLRRVTVSFHSLNPETFARLSGLGHSPEPVLEGLEAAQAAGLGPIKLNVVPMRGVNEQEVVPLARWARQRGYVVRFIEYMDVGTLNRWDPETVISATDIIDRIDQEMPLEALAPAHRGEVATRYRYLDGGGEVGVIASVTQPFCGDCVRARLSAEGEVFTCLFSRHGLDLRAPLRSGAGDDELLRLLTAQWRGRRDRYSEQRAEDLRAGRFEAVEKVEMYRIGG